MKDVEDLKEIAGSRDTATSTQAGGDGAEVGMAVSAQMDELGIEYQAVGAKRLAERKGSSSGNSLVASRPGRVRSVSCPRSTRI